MRIKLIQDIPVGKQHGMIKGREFDSLDPKQDLRSAMIVLSDVGEEVILRLHEFEVIEPDKEKED